MPAARRARLAVCTLFLAMGLTMGSWAARIPDVRDQLPAVSDSRWGLLVVSATAGSLAGLLVVLAVVARVGPRRLSLLGAGLLVTVVPLVAASRTDLALVAGLLVQGFSANLLATSMNAQAVEVERSYRRPIMSTFHGTYSLGQLGGGLLGVAAASTGLRPAVQLTGSSALLVAALLGTVRWLPRSDPSPQGPRPAPLHRRASPQLALLAALALCSALAEGAAVQWSALYTSSGLGAGAAAGAVTFTCFSVSMTASRMVGDRVVRRVGPRTFLALAPLLAAGGLGAALAVGTPAAAFAGFAALGLGTGCVVPTVYGLAGNQPGLSAAEGVSVASLGQWPAFLVGPPVIGALAGVAGLRGALVLVVATGLVIAVASRAVAVPVAGPALPASAV